MAASTQRSRHPRWSFILSLACASVAGAQTPATVDVGGETKQTEGRLLSASAGDVACYLEFADAQGEPFSEMANFDLCESDALHGAWVRIGYETGNVMADSCQGDADCSETQVVALVATLQRAEPPSPPSDAQLAGMAARNDPAQQTTLCEAGETVRYSCVTGSKIVSVCSPGETAAAQLRYRFGKAGSPPELSLGGPTGPANPAIYGRTEPFAGGGGAWVRFRNGNVAYVVYTGVGRWGENGESATKDGVVVERGGKVIANLECDMPPINDLSPELFESLGLDPASDEEFLFPD